MFAPNDYGLMLGRRSVFRQPTAEGYQRTKVQNIFCCLMASRQAGTENELTAAVLRVVCCQSAILQLSTLDCDQFPKGVRLCLENNHDNHPKKLFVLI